MTATVNIAAGGSSGWHSNPGVVLVSVVSGSLTFYDGQCVGTVYPAGSSFVESGDAPGLVRNETGGAAVVYATYLVPAGHQTRPFGSTQPTQAALGRSDLAGIERGPTCGAPFR